MEPRAAKSCIRCDKKFKQLSTGVGAEYELCVDCWLTFAFVDFKKDQANSKLTNNYEIWDTLIQQMPELASKFIEDWAKGSK